MCIGYAAVNSVILNITGIAEAEYYKDIYITEVNIINNEDNINDDNSSATINVFDSTFLSSTINLQNDNPNAFITYEITIYNNAEHDKMFKKVEYTLNEDSYDNEYIVFDELNGLNPGSILQSKASITFTITFHYKDYLIPEKNILNSNLNFLFMKSYAGESIFNMMKEQAYRDNTPSRFVSNPQGIDFSKSASDENGKGIYVMSDTLDDEYPIYYYRGDIDYNNIILGNYCWKLVRTTDTGGTKMIFNGLKSADGKCLNEGLDTELFYGQAYNTNIIAGIGYNYTETSAPLGYTADSNVTAGTIFAYDAIWDDVNKIYKLTGEQYLSTSNLTAEKYDNLKNHHYTCLSTTATECKEVYYVYMASDNVLYRIKLSNGQTPDSYINSEFNGVSTNATKSNVRTLIDTWYAQNMTSLTSYLEDTVYCNDRSIYSKGGWEKNGSLLNDHESKLTFGGKGRTLFAKKPSLECQYTSDRFTQSPDIGNGLLEYPVALLTLDEGNLAGVSWSEENTTHYLSNGYVWWTMSPAFLSASSTYMGVIYSQLDQVALNYTSDGTAGGIRPVVSLKANTIIKGGYGTKDSPFTVDDSQNAEVEPETPTNECFEFNASTGTITKYLCADFETQYPNNTIYDVVIPSEINGVTVRRIDNMAFASTAIYTVEIPSTIEEIEPYAFDYAPLLYNIINKTGREFNWGNATMVSGDYESETVDILKITTEKVPYDLSNIFTLNVENLDYSYDGTTQAKTIVSSININDTKSYHLYYYDTVTGMTGELHNNDVITSTGNYYIDIMDDTEILYSVSFDFPTQN